MEGDYIRVLNLLQARRDASAAQESISTIFPNLVLPTRPVETLVDESVKPTSEEELLIEDVDWPSSDTNEKELNGSKSTEPCEDSNANRDDEEDSHDDYYTISELFDEFKLCYSELENITEEEQASLLKTYFENRLFNEQTMTPDTVLDTDEKYEWASECIEECIRAELEKAWTKKELDLNHTAPIDEKPTIQELYDSLKMKYPEFSSKSAEVQSEWLGRVVSLPLDTVLMTEDVVTSTKEYLQQKMQFRVDFDEESLKEEQIRKESEKICGVRSNWFEQESQLVGLGDDEPLTIEIPSSDAYHHVRAVGSQSQVTGQLRFGHDPTKWAILQSSSSFSDQPQKAAKTGEPKNDTPHQSLEAATERKVIGNLIFEKDSITQKWTVVNGCSENSGSAPKEIEKIDDATAVARECIDEKQAVPFKESLIPSKTDEKPNPLHQFLGKWGRVMNHEAVKEKNPFIRRWISKGETEGTIDVVSYAAGLGVVGKMTWTMDTKQKTRLPSQKGLISFSGCAGLARMKMSFSDKNLKIERFDNKMDGTVTEIYYRD